MSDEILLSFLCNWLRARRNKITTSLAVLKKKLNIEPEQLNLQAQLTEKERELALMTENKIQEYQSNWVSLSEHSSRPCPLCFVHAVHVLVGGHTLWCRCRGWEGV